MSTPQIIIIGNLAADPESGTTRNGKTYVRFSVMSSSRRQDQSGKWVDGDKSTKRISAWTDLASHITQSLHKGDSVIVIGREHDSEWTDNQGQKHYGTEVIADEVGASLRWAVMQPQRVQKNQQGYAARQTQQPPAYQGDPFAQGPMDELPF